MLYKELKNKYLPEAKKILGGSKIRVLDVLKEMIKTLKINLNYNIFILFPTCPLRDDQDIKKAYKIYKKNNCNSQLISISEFLPSINVALYLNKKKSFKE